MPQLDFTKFPTQIFWLLVFFPIFTYVLWNKILPSISKTIKSREAHIQALTNKKSHDNEEAESIAQSTSSKLRESLNKTDIRLKNIISILAKNLAKRKARMGSAYKARIRAGFQEIQESADRVNKEITESDLNDLVKLAYKRIMEDVK